MSVLGWAYYVIGVSVLVALGAAALEAMLRSAGRGGRWAWLVALLVLLAVPVSAWLRPAEPAGIAVMDVLAVPLLLLPPVTAMAEPRSFDLPALLPYGWAGASVLLTLLLLLSYAALRRSARSWRRSELAGVQLWISARTGPAVVGVRRPRIVVPEWVLELGEADRRLMIMHEQEHLLAGDARLLLFALGACVLLPWNPVVWWVRHRLRGAIELDCDARVLARSREPAAYGRLLLEVGRRRSERYQLAAAFAEPRVLLERRVRALLRWPGGKRPVAAVVAGAAALLCFGFAYLTPHPLARGAQQAASPSAALSAGSEATSPPSGLPVEPLTAPQDTPPPLGRRPSFTPFTQGPDMRNRDEITRLLQSEYPPLLRSAGIGGRVITWVFINDAGVVENALVKVTSGYAALDSAAMVVTRRMRFTPAQNRDRGVPVWVEIPVIFTGEGDSAAVPPAQRGVVPPQRPDEPPIPLPREPMLPLARAPTFTPYTLAPEMLNRDEITKLLVDSYPPLLKSAGIGGKTLVWVFIDREGMVANAQTKATSGYEALDAVALQVVRRMRFRPAQNRDQPVPVWVEIPVVFTAGDAGGDQADRDVAEAAREFSRYGIEDREDSLRYSGVSRTGGSVRFTAAKHRLLNPEAVLVALARAYPPLLREAGIGGTVQLRLWVSENGRVMSTAVAETSGRPELDAAAVKLAEGLRFTPGPGGWVLLPLEFSAR